MGAIGRQQHVEWDQAYCNTTLYRKKEISRCSAPRLKYVWYCDQTIRDRWPVFFLLELKKDPGLPNLSHFKQKQQNKEEEKRKRVCWKSIW